MQNPQLILLLTIYLKSKVELDWVPFILISLSNDMVQITKCTSVRFLQQYNKYNENQNIADLEMNQGFC